MNLFKRKTRNKKADAINRGIRREKRIAKQRGCTHLGGPEKPDFVCPDGTKGEVKSRKSKSISLEKKPFHPFLCPILKVG